MFVSNSDNLGATMDLKLLSYFAASKAPFMMEVAARTEADKKGGHLCTNISTGGLSLREKAQCAKEDEAHFQDITKYKYFNTNNLWVNLEALKTIMDKNDGKICYSRRIYIVLLWLTVTRSDWLCIAYCSTVLAV